MKRPSLGTVLGATACVIALSSTGVAADAASLISGKNIKANSITTKQIKNGTLTNADMAPGTLTTGPQGPRGVAGPTGPSNVYASYHDAGVSLARILLIGPVQPVTVLSLSLPAGSYSIVAKATIVDNEASGVTKTCTLNGPGGNSDQAVVNVPANGSQSVSVEVVGSSASASTATLTCSASTYLLGNPAPDVSATWSKIIATSTGSLTNTAG